ncbi:hypothetical protein ACWC4D_41565 [Streptomyces sp. NPDC001288]
MTSITIHGAITYGPSETSPDHTVHCPTCGASHAHTVHGSLTDPATPVTLTCLSGHDIPIPDWLNARELLFTAAMRSE